MQDAITLFAGIAGLDGASRPHRLALANGQALLVERWCGHEQLSDGFQWWVDVLANDAQLDVDAWLGIAATLSSRQTGGQDVLRSGVVCEAACVASDGGLARYRLCLVPWTWLLGRRGRAGCSRNAPCWTSCRPCWIRMPPKVPGGSATK